MGLHAAAPYADVVAALVAAREAPATERFDAVLAAAVAAGSLDPATARALRWWQRESVREVTAHVTTTLPVTMAALARSGSEAAAAVAAADAAWHAAGGRDPLAGCGAPAAPSTAPPPATAPSPATAPPATARTVPGPATGPFPVDPAGGAQHRRRLVVAGLTQAG